MIPKKIHYCWLSGDPLPDPVKECLASWRQTMPEYELICWDRTRFDIQSHQFVAESCRVKKWAFAADYIRLHALFTEGGVYLDSDVFVKKRFDEFLGNKFFSAVEYHSVIATSENAAQLLRPDGTSRSGGIPIPGIGIQAAVLGAVAGGIYLKDCLEFYRNRHFILPDGEFNNQVIAPGILAMIAEKYGFRYRDERQELAEGMLILPSRVFAGNWEQAVPDTYAVHGCFSSWRDTRQEKYLRRLKNIFRRPFRHLRKKPPA